MRVADGGGSGIPSSPPPPTPPPPPPPSPKPTASLASMSDRNATHSVGSSTTASSSASQPMGEHSGAVLHPKAIAPSPPAAVAAPKAPVASSAPAAAASKPASVQQAEAVQAKAQATFDGDAQKLRGLQVQLGNIQGSKPPIGLGAGRGGGGAAAAYAAHISQLKAQLSATQQQAAADEATLNAAKSNLRAAQGVQAAAANYKPAPPPITVNDPVARAVMPVVNAATVQASTGQDKVAADAAALRQTSTSLDHLGTEMDRAINAGTLHRLSVLGQQHDQQQQKLTTDQHSLDAATANLAAGKSVVYSQQAAADQKSYESASNALKKAGVTVDQSNNPVQATLTSSQLGAYKNYIVAQGKLDADRGMALQGGAQLQFYASNPEKYGAIVRDAQGKVNDALHPLGYEVPAMQGTNLQDAKVNLALANGNADYQNAGLAAANHRAEFAAAAQQDLGAVPGADLATLSPQAKQTAATAEVRYEQAIAYQNKAGTDLALIRGQQDLAGAQAAHAKSPTASNKTSLDQAQQRLHDASRTSEVAIASFQSATGAVYLDQQKLVLADLAQKYGQVPVPSNSPVARQIAQARADVVSSDLIARNLDATTNKLLKDTSVEQGKAAVAATQQAASNALATGGSPDRPAVTKAVSAATAAQQGLELAQTQQTLAQYQLLNSQFRLTLPPNQLNPQTSADQAAVSQAYNTFFAQHPGALSDGKVADQLASLKGVNARVDVAQGLKELQDAIGQENTALADRSVLQRGGDWVGGLFDANRSELESTLKDKKEALISLQAKQGQMSAPDFNDAYLKIMGNLETQNGIMFQDERKTDANWSSAQEVVRDLAIAGVATVATLATAGAGAPVLVALGAGTLAGLGTAEGIDTAQNASTVFSGGNVQDNAHISLDAALTNNFFQGGSGWDEVKHAGVDAGVAGVQSFAASAGTLTGGATEGLLTRGLDKAANSALSKFATGSGAMVANQGVMGAGNVAGSYIQTRYQVSEGRITQAQAQEQMHEAVTGYFKNLAVAGVTGGATRVIDGKVAAMTASAERPNGVVSSRLYQTASQLGANTALTAGPTLLSGNSLTAQDYLSIGLNTISGLAIHEYQTNARGSKMPTTGAKAVIGDQSAPGTTRAEPPSQGAARAGAGPAAQPDLAKAAAAGVRPGGASDPQAGPAAQKPDPSTAKLAPHVVAIRGGQRLSAAAASNGIDPLKMSDNVRNLWKPQLQQQQMQGPGGFRAGSAAGGGSSEQRPLAIEAAPARRAIGPGTTSERRNDFALTANSAELSHGWVVGADGTVARGRRMFEVDRQGEVVPVLRNVSAGADHLRNVRPRMDSPVRNWREPLSVVDGGVMRMLGVGSRDRYESIVAKRSEKLPSLPELYRSYFGENAPLPAPSGFARETVLTIRFMRAYFSIVHDVHAHPEGYDARKGELAISLLKHAGRYSELMVCGIPQGCGVGHYTNRKAPALTYAGARALDARHIGEFQNMRMRYVAWAAEMAKIAEIDPFLAQRIDMAASSGNQREVKALLDRLDLNARAIGVAANWSEFSRVEGLTANYPNETTRNEIMQAAKSGNETALVRLLQDQTRKIDRTTIEKLSLQDPHLILNGHLSLTGFDPARSTSARYLLDQYLENYHLLVGAGETTLQKENVKDQLRFAGEDFAFDNPAHIAAAFKWLALQTVMGKITSIHSDWGIANLGRGGGLVKTSDHGYQMFQPLMDLMAPFAQSADSGVILDHAGGGRYVQYDLRQVAVPDWLAGAGYGDKITTQVLKMEEARAQAPGVKFDISWNDNAIQIVKNKAFEEDLIQFIRRQPDAVLFGSDTVKPVSRSQYLQNATTLMNFFVKLGSTDRQLAYKVMRGNFEAMADRSYARTLDAPTLNRMADQLTRFAADLEDPQTAVMANIVNRMNDKGSRYEAVFAANDLREMANVLRERGNGLSPGESLETGQQLANFIRDGVNKQPDGKVVQIVRGRDNLRDTALHLFGGIEFRYVNSVLDRARGPLPTLGVPAPKPGVPEPVNLRAYKRLVDLNHPQATTGAHAPLANQNPARAMVGVDGLVTVAGALAGLVPGIGPVAGVARAALFGRGLRSQEIARRNWESIFEVGSGRGLNLFVNNVVTIGRENGIPDEQLAGFVYAMAQMDADAAHVFDETSVWPQSTEAEKSSSDPEDELGDIPLAQHALMAVIGEGQINGDAALGAQASSMLELDPGTRKGRVHNVAISATAAASATGSWATIVAAAEALPPGAPRLAALVTSGIYGGFITGAQGLVITQRLWGNRAGRGNLNPELSKTYGKLQTRLLAAIEGTGAAGLANTATSRALEGPHLAVSDIYVATKMLFDAAVWATGRRARIVEQQRVRLEGAQSPTTSAEAVRNLLIALGADSSASGVASLETHPDVLHFWQDYGGKVQSLAESAAGDVGGRFVDALERLVRFLETGK